MKHSILFAGLLYASCVVGVCKADIFKWEYIDPSDPSQGKRESTMLLPGTEVVDAVPGVNLQVKNLTMAYLIGADLTDAIFVAANLSDADLSQANLTSADFRRATLTDANFTGAEVRHARFLGATSHGFTASQLYSTASYQQRNLSGILLGRGSHRDDSDLSGWDFNNQILTNAWFGFANLADADFYRANLTKASVRDTDLTGADFRDANLAEANFSNSTLTDADFSGANVRDADFVSTTDGGFIPAQLYSTASYQTHDLTGMVLRSNDFADWDFSGQDLSGADIRFTTLTDADFSGAIISGTALSETTRRGFTEAQLYSTASYQQKTLAGLIVQANDMSGWDFSGQDLTYSNFTYSTLIDTDFRGADLRGAEGVYPNGPFISNLILPDGRIAGVDLEAGQSLLVRDFRARRFHEPIPVSVEDHFSMGDGGLLQLRFGADEWDSPISFEPGIPVALGGSLELSFAAGVDVQSQLGRTLNLFDWAGVSPTGAFAVSSPYVWDLLALYTTGEVTLVAVPEPSALLLAAFASTSFPWRRRFRP